MLNDYQPSQSNRDFFSRSVLIKNELWALCNSTIYRLFPRQFRFWRRFLLRFTGARFDKTTSFGRFTQIDLPWNLTVGQYSAIGDDVWVYCLDKITIGDKVCVGIGVKLLTGSHDIGSRYFNLVTKPIVIHSGAWIANYAIILPGVIIGEGAVVGACAVVTKDVPPWTVVAGNPARVIKKRVIQDVNE